MERTATELGPKASMRSNNLIPNESELGRGQTEKDLINRNKTDYIEINKSQLMPPHEHDLTERYNQPPGSYSQIEE